MSQATEDEGTTYRLTQRDLADCRCKTITVDSWDEVFAILGSPLDHFDQLLTSADVDGREFVGIKENRHENDRFDIMVACSVSGVAITQHSYIEVREVSAE
jgi:hypothetical protein